MNVLSPLFLAGAALVIGPILFHLIRRATKDRIRFSATQFLKESPPKLQRKSRIQNPWLLALRCLVIALLAFAFARPFFNSDIPIIPSTTPPSSLVIVLDSSASMQRQGAWQDAIQIARGRISDLENRDSLAIIAASRNARLLLSFEQWSEWPLDERQSLAAALLSEQSPGWESTRIDDAVELDLAEIEQLAERSDTPSKNKVLLISDMQRSARVAGLAGREWPEGTLLELETATGAYAGNTGIRWLGWTGDEGTPRKLRIGIQSSGQIESTPLTLALYDATSNELLSDPLELYSQADDSRMLLLEAPENATGPFKVELTGDGESFDNTLHIAAEQPRPVTIDYVGAADNSEDPDQAAFYIKRATAGWIDPVVSFGSDPSPVDASKFILIDSALDESRVAQIRNEIENGSNALFLLSEPSRIESVEAFLNESGWSSGETDETDSRIGKIDFEHPSFSLFADPRFSDFSRIRFYHTHTAVVPESSRIETIANYDDGSPAVLEAALGNGHLTIWVGDWSPRNSQWALSSKFVPWLQRLFERAVGGPDQPSIANIDEAQTLFNNAAQWKSFDAAAFSSNRPTVPGLYQLKDTRSERWVALHTPSEESEWDTHTLEDWERLGAPFDVPVAKAVDAEAEESALRFENAVTLENQQQIWRWIIIAVAAILAFESFVARKLQGREERIGG